MSTLVGAAELFVIGAAAISIARMHSGSQLLSLMRTAVRLLLLLSLAVALFVPSIGVVSDVYEAGAIRGIFNHRNLFAFVAALMGVTTLVADKRSGKKLLLFDALLIVACLVLSQSQTSIIAAGLTVFVYCCIVLARKAHNFSRTLVLAAMTFGAALCGWLVFSSAASVTEQFGRDETLTGRTVIWEAVADVAKNRPVLGVGWDAGWVPGLPTTDAIWSSTGFAIYEAHNGYLDMYYQLGIVGVFVLVGLVALPLLACGARLALSSAHGSGWPFAIGFILVVSNLTESRFQIPLGWLFGCIGLLYAMSDHFIDTRSAEPELT